MNFLQWQKIEQIEILILFTLLDNYYILLQQRIFYFSTIDNFTVNYLLDWYLGVVLCIAWFLRASLTST